MVKVYIEKQGAPQLPFSPVFWPNFKFDISPKRLFLREIMAQYQEPFFRVVSRPEEADFFVVPYEYFDVLACSPAYLEHVYRLAKGARKKVLLFEYTDYVDRQVTIPDCALFFRVSAYRHHKLRNEIVMPYFVEDMGRAYRITAEAQPLSVGFCGQSQFGNVKKKVRAWGKRLLQTMQLTLSGDAEPAVHARGIFWRSNAIRMLTSAGIPARIIERPFYSLHKADVVFDKNVIRREYIENLRACPLALCVRGDANASQRLYETFAASRIPLLVDTDCVLPLEEIIPYDDILIRVPGRELASLPERVRDFERGQTPASLYAREKRAREVYEKYLRIDCFFSVVFDRNRSPYQKLLYQGNS